MWLSKNITNNKINSWNNSTRSWFFFSVCDKYDLLKFLFGVIVIILLFIQVRKNIGRNEENLEEIIIYKNQDGDYNLYNKVLFVETKKKEENHNIKAPDKKITSEKKW